MSPLELESYVSKVVRGKKICRQAVPVLYAPFSARAPGSDIRRGSAGSSPDAPTVLKAIQTRHQTPIAGRPAGCGSEANALPPSSLFLVSQIFPVFPSCSNITICRAGWMALGSGCGFGTPLNWPWPQCAPSLAFQRETHGTMAERTLRGG